ncbi:MAG: hypothetical protein N2Z74_10375, partial [Syntrophales bacterium]|nr:hypothetical protein [Syntrophales bacterium]
TVDRVLGVAAISRQGRITAAKEVLDLMTPEERKRIIYGIRTSEEGQEVMREGMFSRIADITSLPADTLPALLVTEIKGLRTERRDYP